MWVLFIIAAVTKKFPALWSIAFQQCLNYLKIDDSVAPSPLSVTVKVLLSLMDEEGRCLQLKKQICGHQTAKQ